MKVKYESEKKEKENSILKKDNELQEVKIADEKKQKLLFASLFAMVFIAVVLVFIQYRNKKKLNVQLAAINEKMNSQNATLRTLNKELIESEENLTQANTTKDQLLAMISHDLYNPVSSVMDFSRQVISIADTLSKEELKEAMQKVGSGVTPLQDLLDNILQWARLQRQELVPQPENVSVSKVIKDAVELYQPAAAFKKVKITTRGLNVPEVRTDRLMLYIILRNVVNNAVKFAPAGSEISISTLVVQNILEIIVSDKGNGFPEELRAKLNNTDETVSTHGSGIGLSVSRKFIKALNGKIRFENDLTGGAKVVIRIPGQ
jgi:signal transduction histidine kinase